MLFDSRQPAKRDAARKKKSEAKLRKANESQQSLHSSSTSSANLEDTIKPPLPARPQPSTGAELINSRSTPNLSTQPPRSNPRHGPLDNRYFQRQAKTSEYVNQGAALADRISDHMNHMLTILDREDLQSFQSTAELHPRSSNQPARAPRHNARAITLPNDVPKLPTSTHFNKVWLYANSRLPPHLPPLKLYLPTYPLLCLSAQHSLSVYVPQQTRPSPTTPSRATSVISTTHHVPSSLRTGTKAMTIATATHDTSTSPVILIAIRGSTTFMDWAVNTRQAPTPPKRFLSDEGNLCHAGFLAVARSMTKQIADQLRSLITEKPERARASVVLTGHSAGGAVATLLYMHLLSGEVDPAIAEASELCAVVSAFKRAHCVTFGAPPVSLLPLQKPTAPGNKRVEKSLFFAFINEGDPVARADVAFVKSLLCLYTAPAPETKDGEKQPVWPVPPGTLSCAGRLVLLRPRPPGRRGSDGKQKPGQKRTGLFKKSSPNLRAEAAKEEIIGTEGKVQACMITDEQMRGVVFGDPMMHAMRLYAERIERMAVDAVTAGGGGVLR